MASSIPKERRVKNEVTKNKKKIMRDVMMIEYRVLTDWSDDECGFKGNQRCRDSA